MKMVLSSWASGRTSGISRVHALGTAGLEHGLGHAAGATLGSITEWLCDLEQFTHPLIPRL